MPGAYDIIMMGHLSKDFIVYQGEEELTTGGAVVYSSAAAVRSGARVLAVTKCAASDKPELAVVENSGAEVRWIESARTTSIRNVYHTIDREKRTTTLVSGADPFTVDEIPTDETRIFHLAGLFVGELPDELIRPAAARAELALDVQGVLRNALPEGLVFRDWAAKREYLPYVSYLKTDAAEAEILTGTDDRRAAAQMLCDWGAREVMITHSSEVLVRTGGEVFSAPLTPRNLSGRTGRGDTCFAAYLARRLHDDVETSVRFAAALVSMKMEKPGVFTGTIEDVRRRMEESA